MNKICTSLEQSKKLVELGIDVKTADMYWWDSSKRYYIEAMDDGDFNEKGDIPAWSLSALLELIPSNIFLYSKLVKWDGSYYIEHREMLCNNPVDAVFEMVVWLKENNKL